MRSAVLASWLLLLSAAPAQAQGVDGYVSTMTDLVPQQGAAELRARVYAERRFDISDRIRVMAAGFAEGLVADRERVGRTTAGVLRPQELYLEVLWPKADLRVGWSRVVWGRLDEFLPTDVVNPQDLARFFLEGRSEGRMPVGMVRARLLPSDRVAVEGIYVPFFRRGRFDQLDEGSSPFTLLPPLPVEANEPAHTLRNGQGGVRTSLTTGRVDWSISAYRGFAALPSYAIGTSGLREQFSRFTMVGGDFETVRGPWGLRGEFAARDDLVEGGIGVDRRAGAYRVSGNVIVSDTPAGTETSVLGALDRSFARETRQLRAFAVYNPARASAFARVIMAFTLRDNVTLETSGGLFAGDGPDLLSQFAERDFAYARLKVFF